MALRRSLLPVLVLITVCVSYVQTSAKKRGTKSIAEEFHQSARRKRDVPYDVTTGKDDVTGCRLYAIDPASVATVKQKLGGETKMIKFNIALVDNRNFTNTTDTHIYKLLYWVRASGRHGTGLLLLPPTYYVLSLNTLEYGVYTISITLGENPTKCLDQMSHLEIERLLRELVMNDFQNTSTGDVGHMKPLESVCNLHVLDENGTAVFHYYCCHRGDDMTISCRYLESDISLKILFVALNVLKILVLLFSPRFIPGSLYLLKKNAMPYIHILSPDNPVKFNLVITREPNKHSKVENKFKLKNFSDMPNFSASLQTLEIDIPYEVKLDEISLHVKHARLLSEDYAAVSLKHTLYESCFKCKIRNRPSVKECCETDFFKYCNCTTEVCPWYVLLKSFMEVVMIIILTLPWILRIFVYFEFEHDEMTERKAEAKERNLKFYFSGNVTVYLTPVHIVFWVIYILLTVESIVYGLPLMKQTKGTFKLVLRKCFRDMREVSKIQVVGMLTQFLVKPCTRFGGFGVCIAPVLWIIGMPVLLIAFSFFMFPTINITFRLMGYFILFILPRESCGIIQHCPKVGEYLKRIERNLEMEPLMSHLNIDKTERINNIDKTERMKYVNTGCKRFLQLIIIILCLISLYSVIFLITEFVSFLVEVFSFTLMGLILNANNLLAYFSLVFILAVYGYDCFGHVTQVFLAFNKTIAKGLGKKKVEDRIYNPRHNKINRAFKIRTDKTGDPEMPVIVKNPQGLPRWSVKRLILFLSEDDKPMVPKSFYFKSCKMNYYGVPGEVLFAYLRASMEFGIIILFLVFVLLVVLAFGDSNEISTGNQLFAAVAGGILPFFLRTIVFKTHSVPEIDTDSIHFQVCLDHLIDEYQNTWPIYDITIKSAERLTRTQAGKPTEDTVLVKDELEDEYDAIKMKPDISELKEADNSETNKTEHGEPLSAEQEQLSEKAEDNDAIITKATNAGESDSTAIDVLIDISKGDFEYTTVDV